MSKRLSFISVVLCASGLVGCGSITIVKPSGTQPTAATPTSSVSVPVELEITRSVYDRDVIVTGGGTTTTTTTVSNFNTSIKPGTQNTEVLTTTVPLTPGSYTLTASGKYQGWSGVTPITRTSSFTVPSPPSDVTIGSISPLIVRRNGAPANLSVTITRSGGFAGPVTLSLSSPPPGISAAATTTIPAGSTTGQLSLSASAGADYGEQNVTVRAAGTGVSDTETFKLRVFHATGSFTRAPVSVTTPPQTALSPNGANRVTARVGSNEGLPSAYAAVFERAAGATRLGQPVAYNHGPLGAQNYAGSGFCAGSTAGFVIAGDGPGVVAGGSAQYVASVFEFANQPFTVGQTDLYSFRPSTTAPYSYAPTVYFNSDCTLALVVGAHPIGPINNIAIAINLKTASTIGSFEFDQPSFTATVVDVGTQQQIRFTSGGQTQNLNLH